MKFCRIYFISFALMIIHSCDKPTDCDQSYDIHDSVYEIAKESKEISFKDTELVNLPCELFKLKELEKLDLFNTDLKKISPEIKRLKKLKQLNLSWNRIDSFPQQLFKLTELEELIIYGAPNEDIQLPDLDGIQNLKNLKVLDLSSYTFDTLPTEIIQVKSLENLNLSAVGLKQIPENIGSLTNLKKLSIQVNPEIDKLPESMKQLRNLKELWMSGTGVYQDDVDNLSQNLPNCKIYFSPNYGKE